VPLCRRRPLLQIKPRPGAPGRAMGVCSGMGHDPAGRSMGAGAQHLGGWLTYELQTGAGLFSSKPAVGTAVARGVLVFIAPDPLTWHRRKTVRFFGFLEA